MASQCVESFLRQCGGAGGVRGVGCTAVDASFATQLAALHVNAVRTWGVDNLRHCDMGALAANHISIIAGLWIESVPAPGSPQESNFVAALVQQVQQWRGCPAIACWCIGNELEQRAEAHNAFALINKVAAAILSADASRPIATAVAEIGDSKAAMFRKLCPAVDILCVNSYGGAASLGSRLAAQRFTGPFILSEFGTPGHWEGEAQRAPWGAPLELGSTEKALVAADAQHSTVQAYSRAQYAPALVPVCLGSFLFFGGYKFEGTATWYSMATPKGELVMDRLASLHSLDAGSFNAATPEQRRQQLVSALHARGIPTAHRVIFADGTGFAVAKAGTTLAALAEVLDPQPTWTVEWVLCDEATGAAAGDASKALPVERCRMTGDSIMAWGTVAVPPTLPPGQYRLYGYVRNPGLQGSVATVTAPVLVVA